MSYLQISIFPENLIKKHPKLLIVKRYKLIFVIKNSGHFEYLSVRNLLIKLFDIYIYVLGCGFYVLNICCDIKNFPI